MKQKEFISQLWEEYGQEVLERVTEFEEKHDTLRTQAREQFPSFKQATDGKAGGTASLSDCIYLYLLVRHFKPEVIFEIGTWIGTSAMFLSEAVKKNGHGHIYTCDKNNFYILPEEYDTTITRINAMSDEALKQLPAGKKIDFMFTDGEVTPATMRQLKQRLHESTVIATHDFKLLGEKGVRNFVKIQQVYGNTYQYVLPNNWLDDIPITKPESLAVLLPSSQRSLRSRLLTLLFSCTAFIHVWSRRFQKLPSFLLSRLKKPAP